MSPSGTQNGADEGPCPKCQRPSCLLHHWPWDQLWLVGLQEAMLPFTECFSFGVLVYPRIKSEILGKFSLPPGPSTNIPRHTPSTMRTILFQMPKHWRTLLRSWIIPFLQPAMDKDVLMAGDTRRNDQAHCHSSWSSPDPLVFNRKARTGQQHAANEK